ncbi:MAG: hypothetical protein QG654_247 [Patescibacteria group bacterium]|nr:hypothetical protein [Patescibacteria group bacterium]
MLSLFSIEKKILGLDITEEYIRYALVSRRGENNKVLICGEEKIARVEPRNALLSAIRNIIRKTNCKNANVSFSSDFVRSETISISSLIKKDIGKEIEFRLKEKTLFSYGESILFYEKFESVNNKDFYNVFISSSDNISFLKSVFVNSELSVKKFISHKDSLLSSCVKKGEIVNTMIVNAEQSLVDVAIFSPFNRFKGISSRVEREKIPGLIKETYQDFYNLSSDNIGYFFVSGSLSCDVSFINHLSKETRLPVQESDVFVNFKFKKGELPPVTKEESMLYAVALGVSIS